MSPATGPILLVEDDDVLAGILGRYLVARGYPCVWCASAEEAIERLANEEAPSLIVLDINLPDGTGWSVTRSPAYLAAGSPPVVIASATAVHPERLAEFGVAGYLPKPFPLETFMDVVERHARRPLGAAGDQGDPSDQ